jgi:hypothetical protein
VDDKERVTRRIARHASKQETDAGRGTWNWRKRRQRHATRNLRAWLHMQTWLESAGQAGCAAEVRCGGVLMVWLRRRALGWRGRKADATRPGSLHRVPSHSICNVHTYPRRS